jgi:hypothetical protein
MDLEEITDTQTMLAKNCTRLFLDYGSSKAMMIFHKKY